MTVVEAAGNSGPGQCSVSVLSKDSIAVGAVTKMSLTTSVVLNIKPNMDKDLQCTLYNEKTPKVFYATKYVEIENACNMSSSGISADQNTAIFVQHNSSCSINDVVNAIAGINAGLAVIGSDETNPQLRFAIPTIVCSRIQISKFASSYKAKGPGNVTLDFSSTPTGDVYAPTCTYIRTRTHTYTLRTYSLILTP